MAADYASGLALARALVEALGLPPVARIVLTADVHAAATVEATVLVPEEATGRIVEAVRRYELREPDAPVPGFRTKAADAHPAT